jgi:oligopeptide/dipeptide ABC transporter ATP-binding protein
MTLLEIKDLTKHYRLASSNQPLHALDGVTLSVGEGEIVGIVGESGSGKTTLGRCVLRLVLPTSGSVYFKGRDVFKATGRASASLRQQMQIVFQDPYASLDARWRIYDILEEPLRIHNIVPHIERKSEVNTLLREVGLPSDAAYRYPHEFSGGQRQRIGIARALALRPDFIVADEPVSALDVSVRAQILNLLLRLQKERRISMLFIGHDLAVVRQISGRIAVMHKGAIVEQAPTDKLFENPKHPYTRALLSAIPSVQNIGKTRPNVHVSAGDLSDVVSLQVGCKYRTRCTFAKDICASVSPKLESVAGHCDHFAACHFKNELPTFERPHYSAVEL